MKDSSINLFLKVLYRCIGTSDLTSQGTVFGQEILSLNRKDYTGEKSTTVFGVKKNLTRFFDE